MRLSVICGSNSLPTTEKAGTILVVLASMRRMALSSITSEQMPGPSSRYRCSTRSQAVSGRVQAAYRARLPPLEWPPM